MSTPRVALRGGRLGFYPADQPVVIVEVRVPRRKWWRFWKGFR